MSDSPRPAPAARVRAVAPYAPPAAASRPRSAVHSPLWLHANEGRAPDAAILDRLRALDAETLRRYAKPTALEAILAAHFGVEPERVVVTAGADDALERLCRAMLEPGRTAVLTDPTFEMLPRYVRLAGGLPVEVPWLDRAFPAEEFERAIDARTRAAFIVSPNNPTGAAVSPADMLGIAGRNPSCLVVADLAYVEFADEDPTAELLRLPNAVVTRTFSKAWGLAGLRVGYAIGPAEAIGWLRTVGHPFPTSGVSLALAAAALEADQAGTSAAPVDGGGRAAVAGELCACAVHGRLGGRGCAGRAGDPRPALRAGHAAGRSAAHHLPGEQRGVRAACRGFGRDSPMNAECTGMNAEGAEGNDDPRSVSAGCALRETSACSEFELAEGTCR
ncbi:histidinol-phosphate aminotransferase family protein [Synechococcales cyanobacterium CNB]|nr:histidinol-phosphate aminotransferase family protein [Synechococcales cyanobacterium CNB]